MFVARGRYRTRRIYTGISRSIIRELEQKFDLSMHFRARDLEPPTRLTPGARFLAIAQFSLRDEYLLFSGIWQDAPQGEASRLAIPPAGSNSTLYREYSRSK